MSRDRELTRRQLLRGVGLTAAAVATASGVAAITHKGPFAAARRPMNVIAVMLDDNEAGAIDARSMPYLESDPFGSWIRFTNAVMSTPLCHPARQTLSCGQRSDHHGQIENAGFPELDPADNVGTWLADVGWDTAFVGKLFNGWPWNDFDAHDPRGWGRLFANGESSVYFGWTAYQEDGSKVTSETEYWTDRIVAEAVDWLATATEPFILRLDPNVPHGPPAPARRHEGLDCGGGTSADDPPGFNQQIADAPEHMIRPRLTPAERQAMRSQRATARRCLRSVDEGMQRVFEAVEARGFMANTSVWFLNDNGTSRGRHRLDAEVSSGTSSSKRRPYRWCTDAQLRVRWPGQPSRTEERLVSSCDLPATWAAMGGAVPTVAQDGIDIRPLLDDRAGSGWRSSVESTFLAAKMDIPTWWSVLTRAPDGSESWRYTEYETGETELFDQISDAAEVVNLSAAPEHAATVDALSRQLRQLIDASEGQRA